MRLLSIQARNFLGYEELDLDLSAVRNLVVVGPNMAGKSTLLDAVTWALYDSIHRPGIRPASDHVVRDGADLASVVIHFEAGGHQISVTRTKPRGKTATLDLWVDNAKATRHTTAETFERIEKYIGLSLDGMLAGPWMVQKSADSFMAKQPRERKDLLIRLLDLGVYDTLHEAARTKMREFEAARAASEQRSLELRAMLAATGEVPHRLADAQALLAGAKAEVEQRTAALAEVQGEVIAAQADAARLADLTARTAALIQANDSTLSLLEAARAAVAQHAAPPGPRPEAPNDPASYAGRIEGTTTSLATARVKHERYIRADAAYKAAEATLTRLTADSAIIETVPCQSLHEVADREACLGCQFLVNAVEQRDTIPVVKDRMAAAAAERDEMSNAAAEVEALAPMLDRLVVEQMKATAERGTQAAWDAREEGRVAAHEAALARQSDLDTRLIADTTALETLKAEIEPLRAADDARRATEARLAEAKASLESAKRRAADAEGPVTELLASQARREAAETEVAHEAERAAAAIEQANVYRVLSLAFHRDGIPTTIIEQAIPLIETAANEVLARLPGEMSLSLRTQRESKAGGMIDRLDVVVTADGWEREYGMLSVGGRFRVDFALRLGLGKVLSTRSGAHIETLWLDEPLADLDGEAREAVIETLTSVADDFDLTVVVSHHPEFNDSFESVLQVTMSDGISQAVLA